MLTEYTYVYTYVCVHVFITHLLRCDENVKDIFKIKGSILQIDSIECVYIFCFIHMCKHVWYSKMKLYTFHIICK